MCAEANGNKVVPFQAPVGRDSGSAASTIQMLKGEVVRHIVELGQSRVKEYGKSERVYNEVIEEIPMVFDTAGVPDVVKWCHSVYAHIPANQKKAQDRNPSKFLAYNTAEREGVPSGIGMRVIELWVKSAIKAGKLFAEAPKKKVADVGDPVAKACHVLLKAETVPGEIKKMLEKFLATIEPKVPEKEAPAESAVKAKAAKKKGVRAPAHA